MSLAIGERRPCEACAAEIVGAETINGKSAPIEVAVAADGNVWLGLGPDGSPRCATLAGPLLDKAREVGLVLHYNHFATCPKRARFRRAKT